MEIFKGKNGRSGKDSAASAQDQRALGSESAAAQRAFFLALIEVGKAGDLMDKFLAKCAASGTSFMVGKITTLQVQLGSVRAQNSCLAQFLRHAMRAGYISAADIPSDWPASIRDAAA